MINITGFLCGEPVLFINNKNNMQQKPNYFAIVPAPVRYSKKICANAKLLYGEISSLCNQEGYCWATNKYFVNLYEVRIATISEWIKQLEDEGFISCIFSVDNKRTICLKADPPITENRNTLLRKTVSPSIYNKKVNNIYKFSFQGMPMRKDSFTGIWKILDHGKWLEFGGKISEIVKR